MRQIKFRGKCVPDSKYAGEWVTGGYVAPDADCKKWDEGLIVNYFGGNTTITYHVNPATVGQFTGLKDKNGKEIYEGDILRGDYYPYHDDGKDNYFCIVFYDDVEYLWQVMKLVTANSECRGVSNVINTAFYDTDFSKMEVIGNVWDSKGMFRDPDEEVMEWFNEERYEGH